MRKWTIVGASALLTLLVFTRSDSWKRDITLTFGGFSNYDGGWPKTNIGELHAFFWFTNGSRPSLHWFTSFSTRIGDQWVDKGGVGQMIHEQVPDPKGFPVLDAAHQAQLISFKVDNTNLPMRLVVLVQERSGGLAGIKEKLQQWDYDHWHRRSRWVAGGRRYSVTNDFWMSPRLP